jgi:hypothetical protein
MANYVEGIIKFYSGGVLLFSGNKSSWWVDICFYRFGGFRAELTRYLYQVDEWNIELIFLPHSMRLHRWTCPTSPQRWKECIFWPLRQVVRGYWLEHTDHGWGWSPSPALMDNRAKNGEID